MRVIDFRHITLNAFVFNRFPEVSIYRHNGIRTATAQVYWDEKFLRGMFFCLELLLCPRQDHEAPGVNPNWLMRPGDD